MHQQIVLKKITGNFALCYKSFNRSINSVKMYFSIAAINDQLNAEVNEDLARKSKDLGRRQ